MMTASGATLSTTRPSSRVWEHETSRASDLLADALDALRCEGRLLGWLRPAEPWHISFPPSAGWFHLAGRACTAIVDESLTVTLVPGDLLIIPPGHRSRLFSDSGVRPVPVEQFERFFVLDPGKWQPHQATTRPELTCGSFALGGLDRSPLAGCLPAFLRIKGSQGTAAAFVEYALRLMIEATVSTDRCEALIVDRLIRMLLLKAMHEHVASGPDATGWLRAIINPDIGRALLVMHEQPQRPWTVASLAEKALMSRSAFSARFTALVGRPPLEYLFGLRMQRASLMLRSGRRELKEVAACVGYESPSAFGKAFARWSGIAPGSYRHLPEDNGSHTRSG